jgi:hypothetical protein
VEENRVGGNMKIVDFKLHPEENPVCFLIAFASEDDINTVIETSVLLSDVKGKTDEEIVKIAWEQITKEEETKIQVREIVGKEWDEVKKEIIIKGE